MELLWKTKKKIWERYFEKGYFGVSRSGRPNLTILPTRDYRYVLRRSPMILIIAFCAKIYKKLLKKYIYRYAFSKQDLCLFFPYSELLLCIPVEMIKKLTGLLKK